MSTTSIFEITYGDQIRLSGKDPEESCLFLKNNSHLLLNYDRKVFKFYVSRANNFNKFDFYWKVVTYAECKTIKDADYIAKTIKPDFVTRIWSCGVREIKHFYESIKEDFGDFIPLDEGKTTLKEYFENHLFTSFCGKKVCFKHSTTPDGEDCWSISPDNISDDLDKTLNVTTISKVLDKYNTYKMKTDKLTIFSKGTSLSDVLYTFELNLMNKDE